MRYKLPFKLSITRIFANKRFAMVFSLILSFAIWLSVMINENPTREQVFTNVKLNITAENMAPSSSSVGIVSEITQTFVVTLSGPNYIVSSITPDDFVLSADVWSVNTPGVHELAVYCNRNSSKSGYDFKSITPSTVNVRFDYFDTKEFKIEPKLPGLSAKDGLIADMPVVANSDQSTLTVKGPRDTVSKISYAVAYSDVSKTLDTTETFTAYVALYSEEDKVLFKYKSDGTVVDGTGKELTNTYLTLSYTSLKVTQPIYKRAVLDVKPVFTNVPAGISAGSIKYKVDHNSVTVIGTPAVVDGMTEVSLAPIDFSSISTTSNQFEVSPALNDGVRLDDAIEYFTVKIDTSGYAEKFFVIDSGKIKFTGLSSSLKATSDSSIRNVKICGPRDVISDLKVSDLYAVADLSDKSTTGSFNVAVKIKSDKYNTVWQVGEYSATITIR